MSLKKYLFFMAFLSLLLWAVFVFIAKAVDPEITNWVGLALFYSSLFLALSGSLAVLGFFVRSLFSKKNLKINLVKTSFRQSFLFSFLLISILFMLAENLFSWLNVIIIILILSILEYIFMSEK
ncbi:hypothetical protein CVU82_00075 [Candidatus Falkowbacteria bacterium HGW-Falkowbacteria-1]|uniref:Uncharacterized protein n=1 Tax=Candidatus Falkowbacteria bacterium HGW-Falkowbacteria-1 TaxID=2013768 RepID=A0A2N2EA81_9BACT|nr:MAG: hypothetical protein CVU82_00075 [Candidatus Falkowbacteria bacterium HGW-Falkowbacteria-1]